MPAIWKCFKYADLVKMTIEELDFVAGDAPHVETLGKIMAADVRLILITDGGNLLRYFSAHNSGEMAPIKVKMVDATAAGDAFMGGLLFSLAEQNITPKSLGGLLANQVALEANIRFASACGAHAVQQAGAISSLPSRLDVIT